MLHKKNRKHELKYSENDIKINFGGTIIIQENLEMHYYYTLLIKQFLPWENCWKNGNLMP